MFRTKKCLPKWLIILAILVILAITGVISYSVLNERLFAQSVAVLLYHDVDSIENKEQYYPGNFTTTKDFEKQMKFLKKHHYKTLTLDEFYKFVQKKGNVPKRSVLITFDDNRNNILRNAYPILKDLHFHAVCFVLTESIGNTEEKRMTKEELDHIKGTFELASHTNNLHGRLDISDPSTSALLITAKDEIRKDIEKSLKYVDKPYLAYPFGRYNEIAIQVLKELGIKAAFTIQRGSVKPGDDLYTLKRNTINQKISFKKFKNIVGYDDND